jgi:hypothetical protein
MKRNARRTAAEWSSIVEEFRASGESEEAFCERRGLVVGTFRKWRWRRRTPESASRNRTGGFVQVVSRSIRTERAVVVDVGDGIRIECSSAVSMLSVARLVRAIRDGR